MSLYDEIQRQQYKLILSKIIEQDPMFIATMIKRFPKIYRFKFHTIEVYEKIPEHFWEIYHAIKLLGPKVDGSEYGVYALTLHGRGKKYGQTDADKARYLAGCKIVYDVTKEQPLTVKDVKCSIRVFDSLLRTISDINALILRKGGGVVYGRRG